MPTNISDFSSEALNSALDQLKSQPSGSFDAVDTEMNKATELKTVAPITFGEKLVGLTFNPSNDDNVSKAKRLCAELMDLIEKERENKESTRLEAILYNHTVGEILNAQMNVVKLLTLKY